VLLAEVPAGTEADQTNHRGEPKATKERGEISEDHL